MSSASHAVKSIDKTHINRTHKTIILNCFKPYPPMQAHDETRLKNITSAFPCDFATNQCSKQTNITDNAPVTVVKVFVCFNDL